MEVLNMASAKREVRQEARTLRHNGMSVRDIAKLLNVSKGSVSVWVRDIILTKDQIDALRENQRMYAAQNSGAQTNSKKARTLRVRFQEEGRIRAREGRPLHLAGCMLYWAEGAKAKNKVHFVNSDPNMLSFFLRFMHDELGVLNSQWSVHIQCHSNEPTEIARIEQYWLTLLDLPQICLKKTHIKKGSETRKNILENGVCGLAVYRTDLAQHIFGAIQEYVGFDNPDWLF
jgi:AcrR family transcriptional regulator